MSTAAVARPTPAGGQSAIRRPGRRRLDLSVPGVRFVTAVRAVIALGFAVAIIAALLPESRGALSAPGGWNSAIGRVTGFAAAYLMLLMVVLMARIPALERTLGQDRLAGWHRRIGGWPIALIAAHGTFITFGYAEASHSGFWHQAVMLVAYYPDVLAATVAFALLLIVGIVSIRQVRRRVRYETWWSVHLYVYLALGLAFAHQVRTGLTFVGHPLTRTIWEGVWLSAAAAVLFFRIGLPIWRSAYHRLRVVEVRSEAPNVVSVVCQGEHLDRLPVEGGQFFQWRFLTKGLWWHANPYSISALPMPPYLRITVRARGEQSSALVSLRPGTRVAIEGPYGTFTAARRTADRVLLVGAGVGVTPLRAILEGLPDGVDAEMIIRASRQEELVLHRELETLVEAKHGRLHSLIGPRERVRLGPRELRRLVPDIADRDLYICGPNGFADRITTSARRLGVPSARIHREAFAF